jgi:hypothetical protein
VHGFQQQGGKLVLTGRPDAKLDDIAAAVRLPEAPERKYLESASSHFDSVRPSDQVALLHAVQNDAEFEITASRDVVAHAATIEGTSYIFFANFTGLQAGTIATPIPQSGIRITAPTRVGTRMHVLPFLGKENIVSGQPVAAKMQFQLPLLYRGAVVWFSK